VSVQDNASSKGIASELAPSQERIPLTRPVTITIHEPMFIPTKLLAAEMTQGSVSELIRMLLYNALLKSNKITADDMRGLR
jgi:hypothetical protein